jgi:hypothetical protein
MPRQTYTSFKLYEEVFNVKGLEPHHHLMLGVVYNITGKNKHVLKKGILTSSVNDILRQNIHNFGIEKKPKNAEWLKYLEELKDMGLLRRLTDVVGLSHRKNGSVPISNPNYTITEEGMKLFKKSDDSYSINQLF